MIDRSAILSPLWALLRSTRFLVAIVTLILAVVVSLVPELKEVLTEMYILLGVLALVLIGGYSYADATRFLRTDEIEFEYLDDGDVDFEALLKRLIVEVLIEQNGSTPPKT